MGVFRAPSGDLRILFKTAREQPIQCVEVVIWLGHKHFKLLKRIDSNFRCDLVDWRWIISLVSHDISLCVTLTSDQLLTVLSRANWIVNSCFPSDRINLYVFVWCIVCCLTDDDDCCNGPLTRYVKLQVAHAPGMPGTFSPRCQFQRKPLVSDPGMHHGTWVTHVPWCMSGSRTRGDGENVPGIPGACAPAILRIWQEAHFLALYALNFARKGFFILLN